MAFLGQRKGSLGKGRELPCFSIKYLLLELTYLLASRKNAGALTDGHAVNSQGAYSIVQAGTYGSQKNGNSCCY